MNDEKGRLNIIFISSDKYPPIRPAARVIFQEAFAKRGHQVDWLVQAKEPSTNPSVVNRTEEKNIGNGVAYIAPTYVGTSRLGRLKKHMIDLANDLRIFPLMRKNRYNVIQVKDKYLSAIPALIVAKLYRVKFFYWLAFPHTEASIHQANNKFARYRYYYWIRGYFLKTLLYRVILPLSDHIFVQSDQMKLDIIKEGVDAHKMTPVPGSVDLDDIPYRTATNGSDLFLNDKHKNIVYLGTLNRMRQLGVIFEAFQLVVQKHPEARLFILGAGDTEDDESYLKELVNTLNIKDEVTFTGFIPMTRAWEYIRASTVCLSPYYPTPILLSTSPTKLIEYMAMGKAVVGNEHPEQQQVLDESGAGICVPWDKNAFADAIGALCDDPLKAEEMGRCGRVFVENNRTNKVMSDRVEETYLRILGTGNNKPEPLSVRLDN